jgi:hypothetical protein
MEEPMRWLRPGSKRESYPTRELEPVRILTPELALDGFVAPAGQRITDILLRGQDLAFLPRGAEPEPGNWVQISPSDLLIVIPPPLPRATGWQEPMQRSPASVRVGPYRVSGTAHLRPGEGLDDDFRARQPFLPLTGASITAADGTVEAVDVAIVSLDNATEYGLSG